MVSLVVIFWMYVILFAIIGAMRGWAREILVSCSVILALFIIVVLETYVPFVRGILGDNPQLLFWVRSLIILTLVFFGYQTPNIPKLASNNRFARDRLQDILLGVFLGALNGYLVAGSIWYFMDNSGYPFPDIISRPDAGSALAEATARMIAIMPPQLLAGSSPVTIFIAVALAFAFVLVVFI